MRHLGIVVLFAVALCAGCDLAPSSDKAQRDRQEVLLKEAVNQVGMPAIRNFFEMKNLKHILELRDQEGYTTYTYTENMIPTIVKGKTACGGKFTFVCRSVGYGIPAATQFTNPQKMEQAYTGGEYQVIPQADPNGLFAPSSAEGTWILAQNPKKLSEIVPIYCEPRVLVCPFELPLD